jgi:UDP-N-acetylglucosamine 2-epimerase (non-hydrolysing)
MVERIRRQRIVTVLGTRPEIIKCSPLIPLLEAHSEHLLIHTGQHYDDNMDASFFRELGLLEPDYALGVGSAGHGAQLARMLLGIEPVLLEQRPDWVLVQGDTNSTLAGALAATKLGIPVAHLEAGCRSFNRAMPEEINRVLVDHIAALCLAPDELAAHNLRAEGVPDERVVLVGSTGVDACLRASELPLADEGQWAGVDLRPQTFLLATIHRAENTTPERLRELLGALSDLARDQPVLFPVHPRTAAALARIERPLNITYLEPLGYARMMTLLRACRALLTDSGGLQEEAAVLGAPTFILRAETEWMTFVEAGRHLLAGTRRADIVALVRDTLADPAAEARMRRPMGFERAGASQRTLQALLAEPGAHREGHGAWNQPTSSLLQHVAGAGHAASAAALPAQLNGVQP